MIELKSITKKYYRNSEVFTALDNVSLKIDKGEYLSVTGPSGAGKSTLLYVIGGLNRPDSGTVSYNGSDIYSMNLKEKDLYRKKHIGFVFQQFHLMPYLNVNDNIRLACYEKKHFDSIDFYLHKCSLTELRNKFPSELSVGEKQRTAFIRAIISNPEMLLADEPTGNLDGGNSEILMNLISDYNKNGGTVIMISHNPDISKYSNKVTTLERGRVIA